MIPKNPIYEIILIALYWYGLGQQTPYGTIFTETSGIEIGRLQPIKDTIKSERIVFYNAENLFHPSDDSLKSDEDFTPAGSYHWTWSRYIDKLNKLGKLFVALGEGKMPAIIGICEVENRSVLKDLLNKSILRSFHYKIIHVESPDNRGIDVALLYDPQKFLPLKYNCLNVSNGIIPGLKTRDILHVTGLFHEKAYCHIFINHWPSRRGGQLSSEKNRMAVASVLRRTVDSCFIQDEWSNIIIMGDFNDEPNNKSLRELLKAQDPDHAHDSIGLYNLMFPFLKKGKGTHYRVNNFREAAVLDQIIVSKSIYYGKSQIILQDNSAHIYENAILLDKKNNSPLRTYQGLKYIGGISDHLPVYTDIQILIPL